MPFYPKEDRRRYGGYYPLIDRAKYIGPKKSIMVIYDLLLKKIDLKFNRTNVLFQPTTLQIEPTTKCNLRCKFCISPVWDRKGMDMSFEDFKKIIDQFPYLAEVLIQGIGEPLLCKDIYKMIKYCKRRRIMVGITTNATFMDKETCKKLVESGVYWVIVSLDGATKETFEKIRLGANYEDVIDNIKTLVEARGDKRTPYIPISFTGSTDNIHELPELVRLAKEIGADGVDAWGVHYWGDDQLKDAHEKERLDNDVKKAKEIMREAINIAQEIGMTFTILGRGQMVKETDEKIHADQIHCQKIFKSCFVTVDGYVTTCPDAPDPGKMNFGNVLEEDFIRIWNNKKYVGLRKARMKGNMPNQCKTCTGPHVVR